MSETIHFKEKEYMAYEKLAKKAGYKTVDDLVNAAVEHFIINYLIETEEITVKVPSKLLKLVKDLKSENWRQYLNDCVTDTIAADIDAEAFGDRDQVIKNFGLAKEWQFYQGH